MRYEFETFSLDPAEHRLLCDGHAVPLTPRLFDLLRVLVENAGRLVDKELLLKEVWGETFVEESNLARGISVLRKTLGETPSKRYIETVPKRGYRFIGDVRIVTPVVDGKGSTISRPAYAQHHAVWIAPAVTAAVLVLTTSVLFWRDSEPPARVGASVHRQVTFTGKEVTPTLSPDGRRVAYVSIDTPHRKVVVQDVDRGDRVVVFSGPEAGALRWSPDGSELMFWARGDGLDGVWVASIGGGAARKVTNGWFVSCWSPDGSTMALALFVPQRLRLINKLGEEQRTITLQHSRGWIWDLDWSSKRDRLLFVATDEHRRSAIWSIRPDGSDQTKLLSADGEISAARWAPDGESIYYVNRVNHTASLFKAVVADGAREPAAPRSPLVTGLEADGSFGFSADGTRFAYARAPYYSNLWLVEADPHSRKPRRLQQLTHGTSIVERPRVSPDGTSILFNMGYESRANLYTIATAGGPVTQLTFLNAFSVGGVWSPDGTSIAFASDEGGTPRVWIVNKNGTSPRPLSAPDVGENFNLAWAPGPRLLYQRAGGHNFYAIARDTREPMLLFKDGMPGFVSMPEYTPDGKRLVVFWSGRRPRGFWLTDSDGSHERPIFDIGYDSAFNPTTIGWSDDGTRIFAVDGKRAAARGLSVMFGETVSNARIMTIPLNGARPQTVLELPFEEVGGVAMFPDGRRFVVSVYSSRSDVWLLENFDAESAPPPRMQSAF